MAIDYEFSKYATINTEPSLTEQEHLDSCDINKMLQKALKGQAINMSSSKQQYGYDDTTLDGVTHRIRLAVATNNMEKIAASHEFTDEELKYIPIETIEKFNLKKILRTNPPAQANAQNDKQNDEKGKTPSP